MLEFNCVVQEGFASCVKYQTCAMMATESYKNRRLK